jgi:hypothetical protein
MNQHFNKMAVGGLRWTLGLVVLGQACRELFHTMHATHSHSHGVSLIAVRLILASSEIFASALFLVPGTRVAGSYGLLSVFVLAIAIHITHGDWGALSLGVYAMAVLVSLANE